ncbi:MAG: FtsX-like permease family protein [Lachnotalea sp.]
MFFDLVSRNSKRNRKENSLFFSSLLIAIVAFYLILSLSNQDVMLFLASMESDAVNKLLSMIPLFYGVTLFILFFLVYFASKYQLENRKHEFGIYLMMGMRRYKLFLLLLAEDIRSSLAALVIGLPIGIAASELISLITAKLVGLGIVGHTLSFSLDAVIWTAAGFLAITFVAFLLLSGKIAHQEIAELLTPTPAGSKKQLPSVCYTISLAIGIILLGIAYTMAIRGISWNNIRIMAITLICGLAGTLMIFFGLRSFMGIIASKQGKGHRLHTFIFRQLQEEVIHKSNTLAISSLLILAALCCFGCGVAIAIHYSGTEQHTIDYTFDSEENSTDVQSLLNDKNLDNLFDVIFDVRVGYIKTDDDNYQNVYSMNSVMTELESLPDSNNKDILLNNLGYEDYPHLISLSGYNKLLSLSGLPELKLEENEAIVYRDSEFTTTSRTEILNQIIRTNPEVQINGNDFHLTGLVQSTNLVVDRSITLSFALIVSDNVFEQITQGDYTIYQNAILSPTQTEGKSLLTAVSDTNKLLNKAGINYESYLQNMGRQLFYVVAASYITIYLAIVFLIIANTVIGIQFLTQQQRTKRRYQTLIHIGASYQSLCHSAKKQINWYFGIPVIIAAISSIFGIRALFSGLLSSYTGADSNSMMGISCAMILLLCVVEYVYMMSVKKSSDKYLLSLMTLEREE